MMTNDAAAATATVMIAALSIGLLLGFYRLVRGPTLSDRVVALDLMTVLIVGLIGLYAIATDEPMLLRVAMVIALISFVGTVAFAYYLQKKALE